MSGPNREKIARGMQVLIVMKKDQRTGKLTKGAVKDILTKSRSHPHGVKVESAPP
ncbi:MAG: YwbE family protein [Deltaproteobacteria bacterium]|nr:YwbE family protein [Deltaproteobacteria bacterium]